MRIRNCLTKSQRDALAYTDDYARELKTVGLAELDNVLTMSNISPRQYDQVLNTIREQACVCLHFHPDRLARSGGTVAEALLEGGYYRNQFETHLSNGKLDPLAEGLRARWEDSIFRGAFRRPGSSLSERPKYGALDLMLYPDGPAPRFGSCYFRLKPEVSARCSFSYMDSHRNPVERGTMETFEPVLAALMTECFERRFALGRSNISPSQLLAHLRANLPSPFAIEAGACPGRSLNHYIEAQVHGEINLRTDVDIVVADPSFRDSPTEDTLLSLCRRYSIELLWHPGFRLKVEQVPSDFRGPRMPELARRIKCGGKVDARQVGRAALAVSHRPELWEDWGNPEATLQELKCLWHVLVMFGR